MIKLIPILILVALFIPFIAQAGLIGDIFGVITCLLFNIGCPDPCLQLISITEGGTAAYNLCRLVDRIAGALYLIGWSLAIVVILWGGIVYMTSGSNEDQIQRAKKIIINGIIGAAIVISSGFILTLLLEFLSPLFGY